jgi:dUTP pyrophosphatase
VNELPIDVVALDPDLDLPAYARDGDAGLDLRARTDAVIAARGGRELVPTGIAIALPNGHCGLVMPRSGLALNHGITVLNAPGLIDAAYRGEIKVVLVNTSDEDYTVTRGDRIAQLVVQQVERVTWRPVEALDGEHRGGGFGHTGR